MSFEDYCAPSPVRPTRTVPKGNYAAFIVYRKGTPQEWHQPVGKRDTEIEADMCVQCALDMSGAGFGYVTLDGVPIRCFGPSRGGRCVSLRPMPGFATTPTT